MPLPPSHRRDLEDNDTLSIHATGNPAAAVNGVRVEDRVDVNEARIAELTSEVATLRRALRHIASGHRVSSLAETILDEAP